MSLIKPNNFHHKTGGLGGKFSFTLFVENSVNRIVNVLPVEHANGMRKMTKILKKAVLGAVLMAVSVQPAQACWTNAAQDAAKIKHLNTMLMVTALRCRNTIDNFLPSYNQFVVKHNSLIGAQNAELRHYLSATYGARGAESALDRMSIGYANSYGNGHKEMDCGQLKDLATRLASEHHGVLTMAAVADVNVVGTSWTGATCPKRMATRP
jgi:hypothetical protein